MKKIISLVCVLALTLAANAEFIRKANPRMAAQQDLEVAVDGAVAWCAAQDQYTNYYEYQLSLEKQGQQVATLTIYTAANNKLAGWYAIAYSSGSKIGSTLVYGVAAIECKTPQSQTAFGTYEIHASLCDGTNNYALDGTLSDLTAIDYQKYMETKDFAKSAIALTDAAGCPGELREIFTGYTEGMDEETYYDQGYWNYWGNDDNYYTDLYCPFQSDGQNYFIGDGAYYVEGQVFDIDWTTSTPINPRDVVRGVMEVDFVSDTEAYFSAFLQCTDGNVYYMYDFEQPTGNESVKAAEVEGTAKTMDQNGQLMIIREGVRYNAQGAVIRK